MKSQDIYLLAIIDELQPKATYAAISIRSRIANHFLGPKLDDLTDRGFVRICNSEYTLAQGVREAVLN